MEPEIRAGMSDSSTKCGVRYRVKIKVSDVTLYFHYPLPADARRVLRPRQFNSSNKGTGDHMKTLIKQLLSSLAITSTLVLSGTALAATQADFDKAYAAAAAAVNKAAAMKNEWRDSGKILKHAKKAAAAGDFDKAISLAAQAKFQGDTAQEQARAQANAGNPNYLYN